MRKRAISCAHSPQEHSSQGWATETGNLKFSMLENSESLEQKMKYPPSPPPSLNILPLFGGLAVYCHWLLSITFCNLQTVASLLHPTPTKSSAPGRARGSHAEWLWKSSEDTACSSTFPKFIYLSIYFCGGKKVQKTTNVCVLVHCKHPGQWARVRSQAGCPTRKQEPQP